MTNIFRLSRLAGIEIGPKRINNVQLEFSDVEILQMAQVECFESAKKKSGYNYTLNYLSLDEVEYDGADGDFWVRILVVWQNNQSNEYNFRYTKKSI